MQRYSIQERQQQLFLKSCCAKSHDQYTKTRNLSELGCIFVFSMMTSQYVDVEALLFTCQCKNRKKKKGRFMALMFDPAGASQQARYKYKKEKQSPGKLKKK